MEWYLDGIHTIKVSLNAEICTKTYRCMPRFAQRRERQEANYEPAFFRVKNNWSGTHYWLNPLPPLCLSQARWQHKSSLGHILIRNSPNRIVLTTRKPEIYRLKKEKEAWNTQRIVTGHETINVTSRVWHNIPSQLSWILCDYLLVSAWLYFAIIYWVAS